MSDSDVVGEAVVGDAVEDVAVAELVEGAALVALADGLDVELVELEHAATNSAVLVAASVIAARRRFTIPPDAPYGHLHLAASGNLPRVATCRACPPRGQRRGIPPENRPRNPDWEVPL